MPILIRYDCTECDGCMPRPYGRCLDKTLIPDVCGISCEKGEEPQVSPSLEVTVMFNHEDDYPTQAGEPLYIQYTVTNDGDVPVDDVVADLMDDSFELGTLEVEEYFTGASIYTLTADDVARGYVTVPISATGSYQGVTVSDSVPGTYVIAR